MIKTKGMKVARNLFFAALIFSYKLSFTYFFLLLSASRADLKQLGFETIKMKSMCFINIKNLNYDKP